jgi:hypothetical protein
MTITSRSRRLPVRLAWATTLFLGGACVDSSRVVGPGALAPLAAESRGVEVEVRDATTGAPVQGAQLALVARRTAAARIGVMTDTAGRARAGELDALPPGAYQLMVRRIGYAPYTVPLTLPLAAGAARTFTVRLVQVPGCMLDVLVVLQR